MRPSARPETITRWTLTLLTLLATGDLRAAPAGAAAVEETPPAAVQPAPAAVQPAPIGPFSLRGPGGRITVGLIAQLQLSLGSETPAPGAARTVDPRLQARRVRQRLTGALLDDRLAFLLHLSTAPGALWLLDLWADWRLAPEARLRIGRMKIPFTRHRLQSVSRLLLVDWALAAVPFGAEWQTGAMVHNGTGKGRWAYAAGVFAGLPDQPTFGTGLATAYGVPRVNPSDLAAPTTVGPALHPELVVRVAHGTPGMDAMDPSDARGGPLRHSLGLNLAWDARPVEAYDLTLRAAPELLLKAHHLSLELVAYLGAFEPRGGGALETGLLGWTAEAGFRLSPRVGVAARWSGVHRTSALRADAGTPAVTDQEIAAGLDVYLAGDAFKWQLDLSRLYEARTDADRDAWRLRTQLQLAF